MIDEKIQYIADVVINTRDFCGDEHEAMIDAAYDMKIRLTSKGRRAVMSLVNNQWAQFQQDAGVIRPIDCYERISIEKALNNANQ